MKLKDVGFFQQHVEKIILGVAALFLLVILYRHLIRAPYAVEMSGRDVPPGQVEGEILQAVEQLDGKLKADTGIPPRKIPPYAQDFQARLSQTELELASLPWIGGHGIDVQIKPPQIQDYYLPRPPMAEGPVALAGYGVLGDHPDSAINSQLAQFVIDPQTRDFRSVTVTATFDMDKWVKRLQAPPRDASLQPLPQPWWSNKLAITAVYLQRQELDPQTGQWGNTTFIDPLPIQQAFLPKPAQWTSETAEQAVRYLRQNQYLIARPPFVPLANGQTWRPPDPDARQLTEADYRELQRLDNLRRQYLGQLETIERRLKALREQTQRQRSQPVQQSPFYNERGMGPDILEPELSPDMMGRGGRPVRPQRPAPQPVDPVQELQNRRNTIYQELQKIEAKWREIWGVDPTLQAQQNQGMPYMDPAMIDPAMMDPTLMDPTMMPPGMIPGQPMPPGMFPGQPMPPTMRQPQRAGQQGQMDPNATQIQVWAHDLSVKPGRTYRYRVVVAVLNPLFRQSRVSQEQQEQFYNLLALGPDGQELEASPWSNPVDVDKEHYFFLVGGSADRQMASVEVWTLYEGKWRHKNFDVQPGDPIGQVITVDEQTGQVEIDMRVHATLIDLMQVEASGSTIPTGGETRVVYLDHETQRIAERIVERDRDDPDRIRLQIEQAVADRNLAQANRN